MTVTSEAAGWSGCPVLFVVSCQGKRFIRGPGSTSSG